MRSLAVVFLLAAACTAYDKKQLPNAPPLAVVAVSPTGNVAGGTTLTVDGSGSSDPEGKQLEFKWTQVAGEPVVLTAPGAAITQFTAPMQGQVIVLALTVNDGFQDGTAAYARVVVDNRTRPVADAGDAREVVNGTSILLSGRSSDADGDAIVTHAWAVVAEPSAPGGLGNRSFLGPLDVATPVFQPLVKGLFLLSYTVTDARGDTSLPSTVAIRSLNAPPVLHAGAPRHTPNRTAVTLTVDASDRDAGELAQLEWSWSLESSPPGAPLPLVEGLDTASLDVTPLARGLYAFTVTASDGEDDAVPVRVLLAADNNAPVATPRDFVARKDVALPLTLVTTDVDADPVSLSWEVVEAGNKPFALVSDAPGGPLFVPGAKGAYRLRATPADGTDSGASVEVNVSVENAPPVATVVSGEERPDGRTVVTRTGRAVPLSARASDPDGDVVAGVAWTVTGVPGNAEPPPYSLSGATTANPVFTPLRKGTFVLQVVARDADGAASLPAVLFVEVENAPPAIALPNLVEGRNRVADTIDAVVTDPDAGDELTFRWTLVDAPPSAALPVLDGILSPSLQLTPRGKGLYAFELSASDGDAEVRSQVLFSAGNTPPTLTSRNATTDDRTPVALFAETDDADGDPVIVHWSVESQPPLAVGGTFDREASGRTTFTPVGRGSWTLTGTPSDGTDPGTPATITVTSLNRRPVAAATASLETATTGERFTIDAGASSDPDFDFPLTFAWSVVRSSATLVSGAASGVVTVEAGPVKEIVVVRLVVTDSLGFAADPIELRVPVDNSPPVAVAGPAMVVPAGGSPALDGGASYDLESPAAALQFRWTSLSVPPLALSPSGDVRAPTFLAPTVPGRELPFELRVFDGRAWSAPSRVTHVVTRSDYTHVFVDAATTCGAACDGSRALPFRQLQPAITLATTGPTTRAVAVAVGTYGPATVMDGVLVEGGCDPSIWLCTNATGVSVIEATNSNDVALRLSARLGAAPSTVRGFTVRGNPGGGSASGNQTVLCDGCRTTLEDLNIDAQGDLLPVENPYGLVVQNTAGPVVVRRVNVTAGRGVFNRAVAIYNASDVLVTESTLATRPRARAGAYNANRVIDLDGAGGNIRFTRNRITAEGDTSVSSSHWAYLGGTAQVTFANNFFWYRAATQAAHLCCGADGTANTGLQFGNTGNTLFTNNTFLGNATAYANNIGNNLALTTWAYSPGSSGTNTFTNNYVERFRTFWRGDGATLLARSNSFSSVDSLACASFVGCTDVAGLNAGFTRVAAGSGNVAESCSLVSSIDGDFHLGVGSRCVDTGVAEATAGALDLDGQPRTAGAGIDRGADEVQP